jgi:hypothetical protein
LKVDRLKEYKDNWTRVWHGTRQQHILSIMRYGLKRPGERVGDKVVEIPGDHIRAGVSVDGVANWSDAIFVSPSIKYASDRVYSDRIVSPGNGEWCLLVEAAVHPFGFSSHDSTLLFYNPGIGEDPGVEFRVEPPGIETDLNQRESVEIDKISSSENVVVLAITLLKDTFIQNTNLPAYQLRSLVQGDNFLNVSVTSSGISSAIPDFTAYEAQLRASHLNPN